MRGHIRLLKYGGGDFAPSQIRGGKFRCGKFRRAVCILCGTPRQSPECVPLVCEKFAEDPEFRMGNFAVNVKREISHAKLKCHEIPPPLYFIAGQICYWWAPRQRIVLLVSQQKVD